MIEKVGVKPIHRQNSYIETKHVIPNEARVVDMKMIHGSIRRLFGYC